MAKKALIAKAKRTPKFKVRAYTGELPGVTKSSW
jgi:ribosomal protein S14